MLVGVRTLLMGIDSRRSLLKLRIPLVVQQATVCQEWIVSVAVEACCLMSGRLPDTQAKSMAMSLAGWERGKNNIQYNLASEAAGTAAFRLYRNGLMNNLGPSKPIISLMPPIVVGVMTAARQAAAMTAAGVRIRAVDRPAGIARATTAVGIAASGISIQAIDDRGQLKARSSR